MSYFGGSAARVALVVVFLGAGAAHAKTPPLAVFDAGAYTVSLPAGWKATSDASRGLVVAQQDPQRKDAALLLLLVQTGSDATEDQLLDRMTSGVARDLRVVRREALAGGGTMLLADGAVEGIKVRIGATAVARNRTAIVAALIATPADFELLGGNELVWASIASLRAANASPPTAAGTPAPPTAAGTPAPAAADQLVVPAPTRPITLADLAGEWRHDDGIVSNYVSATTGAYAGFSAVGYREAWTITDKGAIATVLTATSAGNSGAYQVNEKCAGTISIARDGTVVVACKGHVTQMYLLRGWLVGPELTVMKLNGPYYKGGIPDDVRRDPKQAWNLDGYWVRKSRK